MNREGLEATIALVNALAFDDAADEFGREFRATQMLLGPYYGVPVTCALLGTEGGLATDASGRVLRKNGSPFPNCLLPAAQRVVYRAMLPAATWKAMGC